MAQTIRTTCCIAGGGPAGMMAGFLLARAGIEVAVLEKHADFFRDFRGDTIHPSTLQLMHELGILEDFLKRPHQKAARLSAVIAGEQVTMADFTHLPTVCKFIAFMPQWDFLDFIAEKASAYAGFHLYRQTSAENIIREGEQIVGIKAQGTQEELEFRADLVICAEGRHSVLRDKTGLKSVQLGAPMDVLWMRVPRLPSDRGETLGRVEQGKMFVMIERGDYWQCAYVIPKGALAQIQQRGLPAFWQDLQQVAPELGERVKVLASWDDIKLLSVAVDHLQEWQCPGFLCIGDAAHAMSPVGGVGINLAVQDAVAAANILAAPLKAKSLTLAHLKAVQRRRTWPTAMTQRLQVFIQNRVITGILSGGKAPRMPWQLKLLRQFPILQRIPARVIGMGFRPEHIRPKP